MCHLPEGTEQLEAGQLLQLLQLQGCRLQEQGLTWWKCYRGRNSKCGVRKQQWWPPFIVAIVDAKGNLPIEFLAKRKKLVSENRNLCATVLNGYAREHVEI